LVGANPYGSYVTVLLVRGAIADNPVAAEETLVVRRLPKESYVNSVRMLYCGLSGLTTCAATSPVLESYSNVVEVDEVAEYDALDANAKIEANATFPRPCFSNSAKKLIDFIFLIQAANAAYLGLAAITAWTWLL
jgi:hypothetical protein